MTGSGPLNTDTVSARFSLLPSLGDGEAATIAFAHHNQFAAVLDERKARRVASERFPQTELVSTVGILRLNEVVDAMADDLPDAVYSALSSARMRVLGSDAAWVVECVGIERARACHATRRWLQRAGR
jgi:predicted nucleic acid-binding protein